MVLIDWNNFVHIIIRGVLKEMDYYVEDFLKKPAFLDEQIAYEVVTRVLEIPLQTTIRGSRNFIFCQESKSWRMNIFPDYKAHKDDDEKMKIYRKRIYNIGNISKEILEDCSQMFIQVDGCEGDDIIAVLSKHTKDEILIVSNDKDLRQLINPKVSILSLFPFKLYSDKNFTAVDKAEMMNKLIYHGDSADNIPSVVRYTEFSSEFLLFLDKRGIEMSPREYLSLSEEEQDRLTKDFDVFERYLSGSNKGKFKKTKMVFKRVTLMPKLKKEIMNGNCSSLVKENIKRNTILIDFNNIPENLVRDILETYRKRVYSKRAFNRDKIKMIKNPFLKQLILQTSLVNGWN